jgi:hypothetical protein
MTIFAEFTPLSVGSHNRPALDVSNDAVDERFIIGMDSNGKAYVYTEVGNVSQGALAGTTTLVAGTTYKLAAVLLADGKRRLYVNGTLEANDDQSAPDATAFEKISLGKAINSDVNNVSYSFTRNGKIFNGRALSDQQVAAL